MEYTENDEKQLKGAYTVGAITMIIALSGILVDVIISIVTGGNLSVFAMPGGLLLITWMVLFTIRLFKLSRQ